MNTLDPQELARVIDHTLLKPDAANRDIARLCEEAWTYGFASVCVQPFWVQTAARALQGSGVPVGTVIGFPFGANTTAIKMYETKQAMKDGATELDMVLSLGAAKSGIWPAVQVDIEGVTASAHAGGAQVKVILECAYLTEEEKRQAAEIVADAGAAFVKTSTGFGPHGATIEDVRLLRSVVGERCGVKAAGGIRDLDSALALLEAGANRLGTSAGIAIIEAAVKRRQGETP
jgi:deoxyribose-phosphate aldolase